METCGKPLLALLQEHITCQSGYFLPTCALNSGCAYGFNLVAVKGIALKDVANVPMQFPRFCEVSVISCHSKGGIELEERTRRVFSLMQFLVDAATYSRVCDFQKATTLG